MASFGQQLDQLAEKLGIDPANASLLFTALIGFGGFILVLLLGTTWREHGWKSPKSVKNAQKIQQAKAAKALRDPNAKYSRAEVAQHNKETDCWIIIKHRERGTWGVYDVTSYVDEHPGGPSIYNNAGKDATEGFYGLQHPSRAFDMIDDFFIGQLSDP